MKIEIFLYQFKVLGNAFDLIPLLLKSDYIITFIYVISTRVKGVNKTQQVEDYQHILEQRGVYLSHFLLIK